MYRVFACITQEHHYGMLVLAVIVCVVGSCLSILLSRRMIHASDRRKLLQLSLTSIIGGATIWSTHFIAMLAYDPGFDHGYEVVFTSISLAVAILGLLISNAILAIGKRGPYHLIGGAFFGLSVSAMHYLGMSAYLLPGEIIWELDRQLISVGLGAFLGAISYHRIARPYTRYCWLGGTVLMVAAICVMHFTGMSAFTVLLDSAYQVPPMAISDENLAMLIMAVTGVIFIIGFASFSIEINIEHETRGQLKHAALHDPLTGLPNRMQLTQKMAAIAKRLEEAETEKVAVLTIDLNLFKQVNDLHGHAVGDTVLTTIAARLSQNLEADEFIARTGGDEFVALKRDFRRVDQVNAFAERLHALIVEPIDTATISVTVGASIGIATSIGEGRELDKLLHKSDLAMYRAKSEPECHICLFTAEIDQQSHDRLVLINDLRNALENDQFELVYQLQNNLNSLEPTGFEVLLRWNHPDRGRIPPDEFIPIAEETGLIRDIGLWVLRTACQEASDWADSYNVAVNVAPQQLVQPSFVEHVADILMESRLPPERLELEITEASIIDDQAHTLKVMHRLKGMGIRIAMDDFGTGYSSLATLQAFPFDKIKIDRSFVRDVHHNDQRAAIVRSTLLLGAALEIPVLAEGVELQDELDFLRSEKCNAVQGFYFGQPLSRDEMRKFVTASKQSKAS
ncbi:EAL domain-containing protein [uncultured Roseovarius sp.]|uniref:putative bifunctional diguanylate cyclase/phosphodiesterase n=1 Tax=uncultured Roseovarius sp. TaxID=293344 RepID=UPI00261ADD88|nr:EAL domain-containing protein [uncultured Roseovarius sp.]